MKKLVLFLLLLSIFKAYSQQKFNWAEVLYGDIKGLKENRIKTLKLKQGNKVLRFIEVISDKSILVKDSLHTEYYDFDDENRLICVKSVKDNWEQNFILNFKDNNVNQVSRKINNNGIVVFNKFLKVLFNNSLYEEREVYNFDSKKNDSLYVFRTRYFFNQENPDLSYKETYDNRNVWSKKYFNQTEVRKKVFKDYFIVDSTLQKDYKVTKYHFENYPNRQIIIIEKDSIITIHKEYGKKVIEKLEYAGLPFREIFYDEKENIKQKIIYKNYKNPFNEWVLWEERKYDGKGGLTSRKRPNKKEYKLKNEVLVYRKNVYRVRSYDMICSVKRNSSFNYLQSYSPSILFSIKWVKNFTDNFDTYIIEEDRELIYGMLHFNVNGVAEIRSNYSASTDVKNELLRTAKSMTRNGRDLKYFKDLEVEAETISGKKYNINLIENTDLLSFPIHTFLIKEEY